MQVKLHFDDERDDGKNRRSTDNNHWMEKTYDDGSSSRSPCESRDEKQNKNSLAHLIKLGRWMQTREETVWTEVK